MDASRFSRLTRFLPESLNRRTGFRGVTALISTLISVTLGIEDAPAERPRQRVSMDGPCGNGRGKANACKKDKDCCTRFCDKKKRRCRCKKLGQDCKEDRNCCANFGQPMRCLNGTCQQGGAIEASPATCAALGASCAGLTCCEPAVCGTSQTCVCPQGTAVLCGDACVDTESDSEHCGNCDNQCASGEFCIAGGCVGGEQYRIVLQWDDVPGDLDSHLWLPATSPFHIYYGQRGSSETFPFAILDRDDTNSFGPETITISEVMDGSYRYAVFNYSGECCLDMSGATVHVFLGGTLIGEWAVPTGDELARWWYVFDLASNGTLTPVNQLLMESPAPYPD